MDQTRAFSLTKVQARYSTTFTSNNCCWTVAWCRSIKSFPTTPPPRLLSNLTLVQEASSPILQPPWWSWGTTTSWQARKERYASPAVPSTDESAFLVEKLQRYKLFFHGSKTNYSAILLPRTKWWRGIQVNPVIGEIQPARLIFNIEVQVPRKNTTTTSCDYIHEWLITRCRLPMLIMQIWGNRKIAVCSSSWIPYVLRWCFSWTAGNLKIDLVVWWFILDQAILSAGNLRLMSLSP